MDDLNNIVDAIYQYNHGLIGDRQLDPPESLGERNDWRDEYEGEEELFELDFDSEEEQLRRAEETADSYFIGYEEN